MPKRVRHRTLAILCSIILAQRGHYMCEYSFEFRRDDMRIVSANVEF